MAGLARSTAHTPRPPSPPARDSSWHLRGSTIIPLQLVAFRGQFCRGAEVHRDSIRALLQTLMLDGQQEVREAASTVFSGFVRLHGTSERLALLEWVHRHVRRGASLAERHAG